MSFAEKTKGYAILTLKLFSNIPQTTEAQYIGKQLLRCGTSVGAIYREAMKSRSKIEFLEHVHTGLKVLEEAFYWLELLIAADMLQESQIADYKKITKELTSLFQNMANKTAQKIK